MVKMSRDGGGLERASSSSDKETIDRCSEVVVVMIGRGDEDTK